MSKQYQKQSSLIGKDNNTTAACSQEGENANNQFIKRLIYSRNQKRNQNGDVLGSTKVLRYPENSPSSTTATISNSNANISRVKYILLFNLNLTLNM